MRPVSVCVLPARVALLGVMLVHAIGCADDGGGSDRAPAIAPAIATTAVDLPPGQTSAVLAWEPSVGDVNAYYVLESRNEENFGFRHFTAEPEIEINGQPGDRVRIQVIAIAENETFSSPSPPSVPIIFHAAEPASPSAVTAVSSSSTSVAVALLQPGGAASSPTTSTTPNTPATPSSETSTQPATTADQAVRERLRESLLGADVRFPFSVRSAEVNQWLSAQIDPEIGAGLSFVGTGDVDEDDFRELVWTDPSGQLFVSDGARLIVANEPILEIADGIRLRATERFTGLADFHGDGQADWLVEDLATQTIWLIDGATQTATQLRQNDSQASADAPLAPGRVVGHGDFDGDGQWELVWLSADGSIGVADENGPTTAIRWTPGTDSGFTPETSELLIVADLDGDGRDDLLFRGADDRLLSATSITENGAVIFSAALWTDRTDRTESPEGTERSTRGLELIASLDLDGDGTAELAWHDGVDLVVWSTSDTF